MPSTLVQPKPQATKTKTTAPRRMDRSNVRMERSTLSKSASVMAPGDSLTAASVRRERQIGIGTEPHLLMWFCRKKVAQPAQGCEPSPR